MKTYTIEGYRPYTIIDRSEKGLWKNVEVWYKDQCVAYQLHIGNTHEKWVSETAHWEVREILRKAYA